MTKTAAHFLALMSFDLLSFSFLSARHPSLTLFGSNQTTEYRYQNNFPLVSVLGFLVTLIYYLIQRILNNSLGAGPL